MIGRRVFFFAVFLLASSLLVKASKGEKAGVDGRIKKVVVLMLENRSFDHMLGFYNRIDPRIDGLKGTESNLAFNDRAPSPSNPRFTVTTNARDEFWYDPDHSPEAVLYSTFGHVNITHQPWPQPDMSGFAYRGILAGGSMSNISNGQMVLDMFAPERVPILTTLAREYGVFDHWYSSLPGWTNPNR